MVRIELGLVLNYYKSMLRDRFRVKISSMSMVRIRSRVRVWFIIWVLGCTLPYL